MKKNLKISAGIIGIIWAVYLVNMFLPFDLRYFGIKPRTISGFFGILTSPFLHVGLFHILANTGTLFILSFFSLQYSRDIAVESMTFIILIGGFFVWLFGTGGSNHIGASGVIFGLFGFLLFVGIFHKNVTAIGVSVVVFFLYWGMLFSFLRVQQGVSWAGHFWGFVAGGLSAYLSSPEENQKTTESISD